MLYHVAFQVCFALSGGAETCTAEKLVDTNLFSLVECYSAAKSVNDVAVDEFTKVSKTRSLDLTSVRANTRCLTFEESEAFLKKWGPDALVISTKKNF